MTIKIHELTMTPGRLLVQMLEKTQSELLVTTDIKEAVKAKVFLSSGRGADDNAFIKVGSVVFFDRTTSMPVKLETAEGNIEDFYIIKNNDVAAYVSEQKNVS